MSQSLVEIALQYSQLGFHVIPLPYGSKKPIMKNWVNTASVEEEDIEQWFSQESMNIGIVTGKLSNIIVIDVDTKGEGDGRKSLSLQEVALGAFLPPTVTARTQSGGLHLFYRYPSDQDRVVGRIGILPNVDIRADGNQVVVYPSVGEKGPYEWIVSPFDHPIALLPRQWKNFLCNVVEDASVRIPKRPFRLPESVPAGMRHGTLLSYACSLGAKGAKDVEIAGAVREANRTVCVPPISDDSELEAIISWAIEKTSHPAEVSKDDTLPSWVNVSGNGKTEVDEPNFVRWYKTQNDLLCINGVFYHEEGVVDSNAIKQDIQNLIAKYVGSTLSAKVNALFEALKNECFFRPPAPTRDVVNFMNTALRVSESGMYEVDTSFTLNRLQVEYEPGARSQRWNEFLHDLLEDTDILTLQEYVGYCLIPTTIAQKALFMIGKGGEGKSVVGEVIQAIFGTSMVQGELHKLQENRFMLSNLENKLVFYDDDLQSSALDDTGIFKKLVTATIPILVERKGEPHYEILPYARILASGNKGIEACYDHSDGFYRRIILLKCKDKPQRKDDKLLAKKIIEKELNGVVNWALEGLQRLIKQGWEFTSSERSDEAMRTAEEDANSFLAFLRDSSVVLVRQEDSEASAGDIYDAYESWCYGNAIKPLAMRTVANYIREASTDFGLTFTPQVSDGKRGYKGIKLLKQAEKVGRFKLIRKEA